MQRILSIVLVLTLLIPTTFVQANESIKIYVDNQQLSANGILINGTTIVPLRAIFEALDSRVKWDGETQTITATRPYRIIELTIGKTEATKNGSPISLTVSPRIINGSTYVPLRFVSESLGAEVVWDGTTKSVFIKNTFTKEEIINKLVILPDTDYDQLEAEKMIQRVANIPVEFLTDLLAMDMRIIFVNNIITEEPGLESLKELTPRGWEDIGLTWDEVPGVFFGISKIVIVRIGYSDFGSGHDYQNLELNLIARIINNDILDSISYSDEFIDIHEQEYQNLQSNLKYLNDYFAESFVYYYLNDETRSQLKEKAPLTFQFFENILEHKKMIDEMNDR